MLADIKPETTQIAEEILSRADEYTQVHSSYSPWAHNLSVRQEALVLGE